MEPHPPIDDNDRWVDRREDDADAREADADARERQVDARERVLDRWEAEIAARAAALELLDEDAEVRQRERTRRADERARRRDDAEERREAAIERDIRRARREGPPAGSNTPSRPPDNDAPRVFAQLGAALQTSPPLQAVLELILSAGVDTVPGCAAASVALTTQGRLQTAASTASWAAELDGAQLESGEGPMPTAALGGMVATPDVTGDARWPRLAGSGPARSVMSFGLTAGGAEGGALTLYSEVGADFDERAVRIADLLAAHASAALARTFERLTYEAHAQALHHALASRDLIGQAKGILMEKLAVTPHEAFNLLRDTSQRLNIKLRDVADHLVTHRQLPDA